MAGAGAFRLVSVDLVMVVTTSEGDELGAFRAADRSLLAALSWRRIIAGRELQV